MSKDQLILLLEAAQRFVDNPAVIEFVIAALERLNLATIGLTQNEFQYADEVILGGTESLEPRVLPFQLISDWTVKAPGGPLSTSTIGPDEDVASVNIGKVAPALNEITRAVEELYGWTPTTGTFELFGGHGLCSPQGTELDSAAAYAYLIGPLEGTNVSGSAHPNLLGHEAYRAAVTDALQQALE